MSGSGTSLTSRDVRLGSAKWANADIDPVANCDFMSTRPNTRPEQHRGGWPNPRDFGAKIFLGYLAYTKTRGWPGQPGPGGHPGGHHLAPKNARPTADGYTTGAAEIGS